jgi:23S rRNA U2552 (ribose-2'-O)-methylase RlmE/FtsJ
MNPKKNKLWKLMLRLQKDNYEKIKKLRLGYMEKDKFVEDNKELEIIGRDIFKNFNLENKEIKLFIDVCAAPGIYSNIILEKKKGAVGVGISLPVDQGGVEFNIKSDSKYKIFYKDILKKNYKLELPKKADFGIASCITYIILNNPKEVVKLNLKLITKSSMLILSQLKKGGSFIVNLTMKSIHSTFNLINILSKYFKSYKLWKSDNVWQYTNTFYFFGYDFKGDINRNLEQFKNELESKHSNILYKFKGSNKEYLQINNKMNNIYKVRINAIKRLN